jgi:glucosyl-dolichyl phosphate glucuronosyltransferase
MIDLGPRTDVVICCYTELRWDDLCAGVQAVATQTIRPSRILVVVDHNDDLLRRAERDLPALSDVPVSVLANQRRRGLSGARNTAIDTSGAEFLAFLDDDACPEPSWLERLAQPFADANVWVTGGRAVPVWPHERPAWFPPEFDWVIGSSYRGMPTETSDVRNVHGASMMYRAEVFARVGGFQEDVGRVGTVPNGCEETELCIRLRQTVSGARVVYVPASVVAHRVSTDRVELRYFLRRCRAEGASKAAIAQLIGATDATATERSYVTQVLGRAVVGGLRDALHGRLGALARVAMVLAGLGVTSIGYAQARASAVRHSLSGRP